MSLLEKGCCYRSNNVVHIRRMSTMSWSFDIECIQGCYFQSRVDYRNIPIYV